VTVFELFLRVQVALLEFYDLQFLACSVALDADR